MLYDIGDCLHEHQEADVKSYIRCGVKRPFSSTLSNNQLELSTYSMSVSYGVFTKDRRGNYSTTV
jgi:hypothetical protein